MRQPRLNHRLLKVGQKLRGTITGSSAFGAVFVDVGAAVDGIINARDIEDGISSNDLVIGKKVTVWIKHIKDESSLQLTMLKPKFSNDLIIGKQVQGVVTSFSQQGGAFVDIGLANDAFVHLHDVSDSAVQDASDVLHVGQKVPTWIKRVRGDRSVQVTLLEPRIQGNSLKLGQKLNGTVSSFAARAGAFIDIGMVNDALIPLRNLGRGFVKDVSKILKIGQRVTVKVKRRHPDGRVDLALVQDTQTQASSYEERGII